MEVSVFIARLLAVIYLSVGAGMVVNKEFYHKMVGEFATVRTGIYFGGVLALTAGFLIVHFHNRWEANWAVVITVLGWLAIAKGVFLLVLPDRARVMTAQWVPLLRIAPYFAIGMGLYFAYFGFVN